MPYKGWLSPPSSFAVLGASLGSTHSARTQSFTGEMVTDHLLCKYTAQNPHRFHQEFISTSKQWLFLFGEDTNECDFYRSSPSQALPAQPMASRKAAGHQCSAVLDPVQKREGPSCRLLCLYLQLHVCHDSGRPRWATSVET